jgi:hypothetical protein
MMNRLPEKRFKVLVIDPEGECIKSFKDQGISEIAVLRLMNYRGPRDKFGVDLW